MKRWMAIAVLALACGTTPEDSGDTNSNTNTNDGTGSGLTINALGLALVQFPNTAALNPEGPVSGYLGFTGGDNEGASFTVNGADVPRDGSDFNLARATIPDAGPGKALKVVGKKGSASASIDLPCPAEVTLSTEPPSGSSVGQGDTITVTWTGKIKYANDLYSPILDVFEYDPASGTHLSLLRFNTITPKPTDTSAQITLPENRRKQYDVQLTVPGDYVKAGDSVGFCKLIRRVRLVNRDAN